MSHNQPYQCADSQIGAGPSKPVILSRTKSDAIKELIKRAMQPNGRLGPIHRLVDLAKDLRSFIPRRGGGHSNTLDELARDLLCELIRKYYFDGIDLLCLTMDVPQYMTSLRVIPHAKRGKMDGIKIPHGSLSKLKKGSDDLTQYGARSDLLTCGDEYFTKLLFDTVCNQARALENDEWSLPKRVRPFALVVVGGSTQACVCVSVGGQTLVRLNSKSIEFTCQAVEDEMEKSRIVRSEEGEMMVYAAFKTLLAMGFTHERCGEEGIDCVCEFHSDDSDTYAGIGMQAIFNLESTCILSNRKFTGAVFLHGSRKSVTQLTNLGNIFKTNLQYDSELCPTGRGFFVMIDLISVYYTLEQDTSMPELPKGHRAISAVAVTYTLCNHDYLCMGSHGLSYSKIIGTMKSASYKNAVKTYADPATISPVNFTRKAVFMNQNHGCDKGYNLPGVILLLHHAFINRPKTKKLLLRKYSQLELSDIKKVSYNTVRAAAILAGEMQPVPDPIALLSHISCANLILRRWSIHVYMCNDVGRTDEELGATCYTMSEVKGRKVMLINYDLREVAEIYRQSWDNVTLMRKLRTTCYGNILPDAIVEANVPMPFLPSEEIRRSLMHGGYYPFVKVAKQFLPDPPKQAELTIPTQAGDDNEDLLADITAEARGDLIDTDEDESDGERSIAGYFSGHASDSEVEDEQEEVDEQN